MKSVEEEDYQLIKKIKSRLGEKAKMKEMGKKTAHVHFFMNLIEKEEMMKIAEKEGLAFSEWCRQKLRKNSNI